MGINILDFSISKEELVVGFRHVRKLPANCVYIFFLFHYFAASIDPTSYGDGAIKYDHGGRIGSVFREVLVRVYAFNLKTLPTARLVGYTTITTAKRKYATINKEFVLEFPLSLPVFVFVCSRDKTRMVKIVLIPAIFAVILHQTSAQCLTVKDAKLPKPTSRKNLYTGEQEFSLNLLRDINDLNPDGNIFFSPYSTYHALLLAYFISAGKTEQFLRTALRLNPEMDKADLMQAYNIDKYLTQDSSQQGDYEFSNANRIYVNTGITVRDCISELFAKEFERIDFATKPDESRLIINKWVENQTHSMIRDLLPPGSIDQTTNLALVNAGYFKGSWKYEFKESETKEEVFHVSPEKRVLVKMMHMEAMLNHDVSEELGAYVLELPYKGEKISIETNAIYLPESKPPFMKQDGIAKTLAKLTPSTFQKVMQNLTYDYGKTVNLQLPKFSLENTIEMTPILESLGVGNLFESDADFSLLSDTDKLSLGAGIHKAKIDVNEKGSEAAFATALFSFRMMSDEQEVVSFKCNHPFLFLLFNKETNTILFIGIYRDPERTDS
ncbi:Serpin (serine protease inhibitor) [Popillia japonica]|uniref:Serpin (Serine protease inhibitor) n=1 Tax=Popillia japonica TaxID=7064 RepID=A0AAW1M9T8_POPJA